MASKIFNRKKEMKRQQGFTLIELLVVISVISLLASVVLVSLNNARIKSRDAYRKSSLVSLKSALELFYNDTGAYPVQAGFSTSEPGDGPGTTYSANWVPGLVTSPPKYISQLPKDPLGGNSTNPNGSPTCVSTFKRAFLYVSDGKDYKLMSHCALEGSFPSPTEQFYDPLRPFHAIQISSSQLFNLSN